MIDYDGKTALVTGGASGIGRALAEALAARGAKVLVADIDGERAGVVANAIDGVAITADLSDPDVPARLVAQAYEALGRLDLICSNAGLGRNKRLLKEPLGDEVDSLFSSTSLPDFASHRLGYPFWSKAASAGG